MGKPNFLLSADCYKLGHWLQYPEHTQTVYSYLESRGGKFDETLFFGLQCLIEKHFEGVVIQQWMIDDAEKQHLGIFGHTKYFPKIQWQNLLNKYEGKLPIHIKAVPEGTVVPTRNVLVTVENTDPDFPWLTNFCETLLMQLW